MSSVARGVRCPSAPESCPILETIQAGDSTPTTQVSMTTQFRKLLSRIVPAALFMTGTCFGAVTLSLSPATLQFSANAGSTTPLSATVTVTVTGLTPATPCCDLVLAYVSIVPTPYFSVSPSQAQVTADGAPLVFTVTVLPPVGVGVYQNDIRFASAGPYPISHPIRCTSPSPSTPSWTSNPYPSPRLLEALPRPLKLCMSLRGLMQRRFWLRLRRTRTG